MMDPYQRTPKTFGQALGALVPTTDPVLQEKLRGAPRTIQVPVEGDVKKQAGDKKTRTTTDIFVENYKTDVLLALMLGIYVNRIDPDVAEAFILRAEENAKDNAERLRKLELLQKLKEGR